MIMRSDHEIHKSKATRIIVVVVASVMGFFSKYPFECFFRKIGSILAVALKVLLGTLVSKWSFYALIMIHSSGGNPVFFEITINLSTLNMNFVKRENYGTWKSISHF